MFVVFFRRLASGEAIMSEILLKLPIVPCFSFFYVFVAVISDRLLNATLLLLLVKIIH